MAIDKKFIIEIGANEEKFILINNLTHIYLKNSAVELLNGTLTIHKFMRASNAEARDLYDEIMDFVFPGPSVIERDLDCVVLEISP